jgi:hypothetical protein
MFEPSRLIRPFVASFIIVASLSAASLAADTSTPDDTAHFLAGMAPKAESPLTKITDEGVWRQHARHFDDAWQRLNERQLTKIRTWATTNITKPQPTLFYMFSGPDYLYADAFFPNATTYVLSGLEPVGEVPELSQLSRRAISGELSGLRASLNSVLSYSFFITKDMKHQLRAGRVNGTLPVLYVFLARSGKTIDEVSFLTLDSEGVEHPASEKAAKNAPQGVKILFSGSDGVKHTLYYFSTDLSNSAAKNSGFLKFCEKLGAGDALIKSASYLLHSGSFTTVRDFLLQRATTLVQDDSGVPVQYFANSDWELHPYGRYLGPIEIFPGRYQRSLARLFRSAPSLDFGIGYRWRPRESNLLLAVKKAVPNSSASLGGDEVSSTPAKAAEPSAVNAPQAPTNPKPDAAPANAVK